MNQLFPAEFLSAIEQLSLSVMLASPSVAAGSHLSPVPGNSLDFRDFSQYSHGDDLRRVDWNVYRRTGHLFLRRFDHPTTTPVYVLLDTSESMFVETPSRYTTAARIAAAVSVAAMREHDGVSVVPFSSKHVQPLVRINGRKRLPEVLNYLAQQSAGGVGSIRAGVQSLLKVARRSGVVVIISDFFEEAGIEELIASLSEIPHRLVLVQVTQPGDAAPPLEAEVELVDCESSHSTTVQPAGDTLARYRDAYTAYQAGIDAFAMRRGCRLVRVDANADTITQLEQLFPAGVLQVAEVRR